MSTSYGSLVHWTLAVRATGAGAALARAVTPALAARALTQPRVAARLRDVPAHRQVAAVMALGVLSAHRSLRHSPHVPLGRALATVGSARVAGTLAAVVHLPAAGALRVLSATLVRAGAHTGADLAEFVGLCTEWDERDITGRSRFLVDYHSTDRAWTTT